MRFTRLMNDVLMAISMYFGNLIGSRLVHNDNRPFVLLALLAGLSLQIALEHRVVHYSGTLWADIVVEGTYIVSRTLAFVVVAFSIELMLFHDAYLWHAHVVWPALVVFTGISLMKYFMRLHHENIK